ncbi:MAG: PKD domain-containing protein [Candidatus Syntrophosphaera sp.]|jgi:PKD repeat protein|nr:choice-of-anchor D domain-containing protein [Candidatus Cloacimonadota bacterium]MDX9949934.1 PKD domain-containing protein [Candidatus Syntrophosphaera sp.]
MTFPHAENTYEEWDFQNVWAGDFAAAVNDGYPFLQFLINQSPNPVINPEPANVTYEVPLDSRLSWQTNYQSNGSDAPLGFKLRLGTDNPPSNILYDLDLGASLTYTPELLWTENTTYFWQILPYNHIGEADDCPVWLFSTYAASHAEISTSQISFGNVWIDHNVTKTFTVSNLGTQDLELSILLSAGTFSVTTSERSIRRSSQFGQKSDDSKASRDEINLVLSPMSTETIYVHFLPTAQQQYSRNLFIETNAPNLPLFIMPLSGRGYTLYAEFSADPTSGDVPLEVNFQNQSVAGINQSLWDFGDGNTSEEMNPTHTFTQKGVYNVKLTVWDDYFNTDVTHQVTVIAHPLLTCAQEAGHIFTKTFIGEQSAPFEIILQNTGTDSLWVTGAHWRSRNRDTCFTFEYEELGEAIVPGGEASLMVWFNPLTEGVFADTLCIVNTSENIPLLKIPFSGRGYKLHAAFAAEPMCGDVPLKVEFTDLSTEDIIQWTWDFEDGSTSTEQHPVHLFEEKGLYQVELTVSDGIHYDSVSQTIEVIAHPMLASDQLVGHQFTKTYLTEESNAFEILLNSSGTDTLFVDNVYWKSQHRDHYFHYVFEQLAEPIAPGDNTTISVTFAPLGEGVFRDTLCVVNNSENLPLVEIPFSGRGYKLHADFSAEPMCGDVPLTVEFTDLSTEDIIQWNWDFGDGGTSTQQHPVHLFEEKGLYQVELTVSDGIHYDTSSQSIEVIAHPMMTFDYPQSYNFDIVYLGDISESITLTLQSTGTDTLFVNNLWWENGSDVFSFSCLDLPCPIPPGESATIDVWFHPSARGAYSDSLVIESNAENLSVVKVKFSGRGEYVPPKPPANVYLTIEGNHALIHWDEVTQTIYDTPFSPDAYIVFLAADPYDNYTFLGSSTSLSYTHFMVAAYQPRMFYKVMAYKDMGKQEFNPDDYGLVPGMTEEEVLRLLAGD